MSEILFSSSDNSHENDNSVNDDDNKADSNHEQVMNHTRSVSELTSNPTVGNADGEENLHNKVATEKNIDPGINAKDVSKNNEEQLKDAATNLESDKLNVNKLQVLLNFYNIYTHCKFFV